MPGEISSGAKVSCSKKRVSVVNVGTEKCDSRPEH
jgi:hypothetical protein